MLKRLLHRLIWVLLAAVLAPSCVKEEAGAALREGEEVELTIGFGAPQPEVIIPTKGTLGLEPESRVYNMYVFIFDSSGKKFYSKYFDSANRSTSGASTLADWWEVNNGTETSGTIHIHTESRTNCKIVVIANIDAEMVNISPEQLNMVSTYSDIAGQKAKLNQLITSRSGYFPMTGELSSVDLTQSTVSARMILRRLDAKIIFKLRADPTSRIASLTPLKWKVVNIPKKGYVLQRGNFQPGVLTHAQQLTLDDASTLEEDFFDLPETNFETETLTNDYYSGSTQNRIVENGFSFYMMENRKEPAAPDGGWTDYTQREEQSKSNYHDAAEGATVDNGAFRYAHPLSTYVVITARITMDNVSYGEVTEGATLSGDVKYIIHLGDFSGDKFGDFNVFRNHTYIYDVVVSGVNDVRVEVENNYDNDTTNNYDEDEPGATGKVSVALEEVFTCDAHYCSRVVEFHEKYIDPDKVTWVVETPFNPSGASPVLLPDETENTAGVDFEWVEFRVHEEKDENGNYLPNKQVYKPMDGEFSDGKTKNISGLVAYLKAQKRAYDAGLPNDFDNTPEEEGGPKICVTAFVNEYYYEVNPITGDYQRDLWKRFVNQPMRYMHILSETQTSADGESQVIGASFTIQQRSIQSIYNISNNDLHSAWGCEHLQDDDEKGKGVYNVNKNSADRGNTDLMNGRLNTVKEWELLDKNGANSILGDIYEDKARWDTYLNLEGVNGSDLMLPTYQYLRYSCLSRNRDNNGNGVIDSSEVRWYMAASNQLIGIFLGGYGIEGSARLYQRSAQDRASDDRETWRQHVIASTRYPGRSNSNNNARVLWAEEGLTGSDISFTNTNDGATEQFSTRCLRNVGSYQPTPGGNYVDITDADFSVEPTSYIDVIRMRNGSEYPLKDPVTGKTNSYDNYVYYVFDCSRINTASLRFYTDRELVAHDERDEAACLYKKFVVASRAESETKPVPEKIGTYNVKYLNQMNAYLDDPDNIEANPFCPSGYRLCNVREDAVIWSFVPTTELGSFLPSGTINHSRTHWSFGDSGSANKHLSNHSWGWTISSAKIIMGNVNKNDQKTAYLRCVKDIKD